MKPITPCLIVLSVIGACTVMFLVSGSSAEVNLYPESLQGSGPDGQLTREQILETLVSAFKADPRGRNPQDYEYGGLGVNKRQIRFHQCYFNPISCFRRRK